MCYLQNFWYTVFQNTLLKYVYTWLLFERPWTQELTIV